MDLAAAGLKEQAFRTHGRPVALIPYAAHQQAMAALEKASSVRIGITLLQGPSLSGKTTLIRCFAEAMQDERAIAVVDGRTSVKGAVLESLLRQFGYSVEFNSSAELLAMLRVFVLHQASMHAPPVIIVENAHDLNPSALRILGELAKLQTHQTSAIKLILVGDKPLRPLLDAPELESRSPSVVVDFHLQPMSRDEATDYLHTKLRAAGSAAPALLFPQSVCNELWEASGGWPGILDRIALLALARATSLPVPVGCIERPSLPDGTSPAAAAAAAREAARPTEPPKLIISENGRKLREVTLETSRLLIGRSEHNDIAIDSRVVSRHHMLIVRNGSSLFLMDLNSTNGTYVNSRRISNHVLSDSDVISIGHHRLKFTDPHAVRRNRAEPEQFADTVIMKTLDDMRALLAGETTDDYPVPSENMPTLTAIAGGQS